MRTVSVVIGTRPEAIKMAPVIMALHARPDIEPVVISTGQHRQMLDETLDAFGLSADIDLEVMAPKQTLSQVTSRILSGLESVLPRLGSDALLVHGDTATTLAGALAGFHHGVPVVHVEAGLRSGELSSPFPEEGNRRLVGQVSALHLAPTPANRANLLCEGIPEETIVVTGNTVIDALRWAGDHAADYGRPELDDLDADPRRVVLASAHRRDAWPQLADIAAAFRRIADEPGTRVVVPLHRNPAVREAMLPVLAGHPNVTLTDPLPYLSFMKLLKRADLIVSDSSGAQEEGPALGKPTLVLSDVTERSEAVVAGTAKLVGKTTGGVAAATLELLRDRAAYDRMAGAANPYGDGRAALRTVDSIACFLGLGDRPEDFVPETPVDQFAAELARVAGYRQHAPQPAS
ncbi:non-hydrolyzing UDP-N-acetylglucosamine 2-epimerase [Streptomyces sp. NPDC000963]|uniref:non-hydrolyzing UDP-N-acetylglucosamine 2-epimerase n=1 Tax=unclassified Streptomyces TaxID=2593676 RepID=UPI000F79FED5|nr:UDP-N-acetylglucosamine 2-epimerase (non-hydrolyzing) [Streptomyces sp. WAC08241]MYV65716.1 UDP-N-acetylglucosamine 2-epimerase (non-hydrolyzing) [Streptomyces sp. SID2131]RSS32911.1 UDP-N-acetylglucosamine 2-epimerase (non-hydrolyzing) [Streptomyces sp. WAC08241]